MQECQKEDITQGQYPDSQARKHRGGVVPPTENNRIRHRGEKVTEKKSEEDDTRNKQKRQKEREGEAENGKRER